MKFKFNLKNRPTTIMPDKDEMDVLNYMEEWFEGFEKELQNRMYPKWQRTAGALWTNSLIKEIMG